MVVFDKCMDMSNKIASINISVPYKGPGNIIRHNPVSFEVYTEDDHYKAVPVLNEDQRRIANLPPELGFHYQNGRPLSKRGEFDGNLPAIENIVRELQRQQLI